MAGSDLVVAVVVSAAAPDCFSEPPSAAGTASGLAAVAVAAAVVVAVVVDLGWRLRSVPAAHQACRWGRSAVSGTCKDMLHDGFFHSSHPYQDLRQFLWKM